MVLFYTHTKLKKNRRDRGGFDSVNAHGMTLVVKLAERKTEMIGFNGSYNLIDIHNRQFAQGGNYYLLSSG